MIKRFAIVVVLLGLMMVNGLAVPTPTLAQNTLKYGDSVEGEIVGALGRLIYTFMGKKGDPAIIQVIPIVAEDGSSLNSNVTLRDSGGQVLADNSEGRNRFYGAASVALMNMLPADGEYSITVTRNDTASSGKFTIQLLQPTYIEFDQAYTDDISYRGYNKYEFFYGIPADKAFEVSLKLLGASENASFRIFSFEDGRLEEQVSIEINRVLSVDLTIDSSVGIYVVTLVAPGWSGERLKMGYELNFTAVTD
jgi:DUF971 family protein